MAGVILGFLWYLYFWFSVEIFFWLNRFPLRFVSHIFPLPLLILLDYLLRLFFFNFLCNFYLIYRSLNWFFKCWFDLSRMLLLLNFIKLSTLLFMLLNYFLLNLQTSLIIFNGFKITLPCSHLYIQSCKWSQSSSRFLILFTSILLNDLKIFFRVKYSLLVKI